MDTFYKWFSSIFGIAISIWLFSFLFSLGYENNMSLDRESRLVLSSFIGTLMFVGFYVWVAYHIYEEHISWRYGY